MPFRVSTFPRGAQRSARRSRGEHPYGRRSLHRCRSRPIALASCEQRCLWRGMVRERDHSVEHHRLAGLMATPSSPQHVSRALRSGRLLVAGLSLVVLAGCAAQPPAPTLPLEPIPSASQVAPTIAPSATATGAPTPTETEQGTASPVPSPASAHREPDDAGHNLHAGPLHPGDCLLGAGGSHLPPGDGHRAPIGRRAMAGHSSCCPAAPPARASPTTSFPSRRHSPPRAPW